MPFDLADKYSNRPLSGRRHLGNMKESLDPAPYKAKERQELGDRPGRGPSVPSAESLYLNDGELTCTSGTLDRKYKSMAREVRYQA